MTDSRVVPAIIPKSSADLRAGLMLIKPFTKQVQIDIVDGRFVPAISWPYHEKGTIQELSKYTATFSIEMDLMIETPEEMLEEYLKAGVRKFVIHLETVRNYNKLMSLKHEYDYELGLSIDNDSPLEMLLDHVGDADYIQCMGIAKIGYQGNPFDERVLERIAILKRTYPELPIAVDGSVNKKTVTKLGRVGADRFAVGSAIVGAKDPKKAHAELVALAAKSAL